MSGRLHLDEPSRVRLNADAYISSHMTLENDPSVTLTLRATYHET